MVGTARPPQGDALETQDGTTPRVCGSCAAPLEGRRRHAAYCSTSCRVKASRRRRPPSIDPGPILRDLIERYRRRLEGKSAGARRGFGYIARKLAPLADRRCLTIGAAEWESWLAAATVGLSESYRRQVRAWCRAMLGGVPHCLARGRGRHGLAKRPARKVTPELQRALTETRMSQRDQLVVALRVAGFYVGEIVGLRLVSDGGIQSRPNWARRSAPDLSPGLELRLRAYAADKGIPAGGQIFPLSAEGLRLIVKRALGRADEARSRPRRERPSLSVRIREVLHSGPSQLGTLAELVCGNGGSVYKALRRMKDAVQVGGLKGRGRESVWSLAAPAAQARGGSLPIGERQKRDD